MDVLDGTFGREQVGFAGARRTTTHIHTRSGVIGQQNHGTTRQGFCIICMTYANPADLRQRSLHSLPPLASA
jgi:hypothetical protein